MLGSWNSHWVIVTLRQHLKNGGIVKAMTGGLRQGLPLETEVEKSRGRSASEQSLSSEKIGAEGWPFMAMADYLMMIFFLWG